MAHPTLRDLDQRTVAVEMQIGSRQTVVQGLARYDAAEGSAPALHICVNDGAGNFEIRLEESLFRGTVDSGKKFGCDFHIDLGRSLVTK